jgi:hypothetical protein
MTWTFQGAECSTYTNSWIGSIQWFLSTFYYRNANSRIGGGSSKAGMDTAPILFFGSQPNQTIESAGNKPSFSSKTWPHSAWIYLTDPGQFFQSSWVGTKHWLAIRHGPTGKEVVKDAAISDDGKFSWLPELEDMVVIPSEVELIDTVALTSPDVEVTISLFF